MLAGPDYPDPENRSGCNDALRLILFATGRLHLIAKGYNLLQGWWGEKGEKP